MTEREALEVKRQEVLDLINKHKEELVQITKDLYLLSDDKQWFTEEEEEVIISKRPKKTEKQLIGRIHWRECFKDEDNPEDESQWVWIDRSKVVRVDGEWI